MIGNDMIGKCKFCQKHKIECFYMCIQKDHKPEEPESEAQGRGCLWGIIIILASIVALGITNIKH